MIRNILSHIKTAGKSTVGVLAFFAVTLVSTAASAVSVSMAVTFGTPQANGGVCVGRGVCRENTSDNFTSDGMSGKSDSKSDGYINVSFVVNSTNPNVLMMRFSMKEVLKKQPEQAEYFRSPEGYAFDAVYMLNKPVFAPLNLMPSARIMPNENYTVDIVDDLVTIYIPYAHE